MMETYTVSTGSSSDPSCESSSPATIFFCSLCDKPFTDGSAHRRHLRYCTNRTRKRPRSCRACNAAKIKCSFETPCSRCLKKNIDCVYGGGPAVGKRSLSTSSRTAPRNAAGGGLLAPWLIDANDRNLPNADVGFTELPAFDDAQLQLVSRNDHPSFDIDNRNFSLDDSLTLDGLLGPQDYASTQLQFEPGPKVVPFVKSDQIDQPPPSWCSWTRSGASLSVIDENTVAELDPYLLAILQVERPHAQHNINLIIQSVRSFPILMLRRRTFPWFIHPHSQLCSNQASDTLPKALSTCMSIAQMFASRTPETRPYIWSTIKAEYRSFVNEMYQLSKFELLHALQSCMIYLMMCIVDPYSKTEEHSLDILTAIHELYVHFKTSCTGSMKGRFQTEISEPSPTWAEWIFNESQRRLAHLWFLIGCVICVKTGIPCDPALSYRSLALPSLKSLWESTSQSAWEQEYEASSSLQASGLANLGDLIDAQNAPYSPGNAQRLDKWNAGVDNLGFLLNLVRTTI